MGLSSEHVPGETSPGEGPPSTACGRVIEVITLSDLPSSCTSSEERIQDCAFITSFNLLDGPVVSVAVPGLYLLSHHTICQIDHDAGIPPRWTPPNEKPTLEQNSGVYFRDINAAHNPQGSWQAAVEALMLHTASHRPHVLAC